MQDSTWGLLRRYIPLIKDFPTIITLCGSTRFADDYIRVDRELTLAGHIVISVGLFGHQEGMDMKGETKAKLDELHLRKIDLCDIVYVINKGGYIGESTRREINYAKEMSKSVHYMEPIEAQLEGGM